MGMRTFSKDCLEKSPMFTSDSNFSFLLLPNKKFKKGKVISKPFYSFRLQETDKLFGLRKPSLAPFSKTEKAKYGKGAAWTKDKKPLNDSRFVFPARIVIIPMKEVKTNPDLCRETQQAASTICREEWTGWACERVNFTAYRYKTFGIATKSSRNSKNGWKSDDNLALCDRRSTISLIKKSQKKWTLKEIA